MGLSFSKSASATSTGASFLPEDYVARRTEFRANVLMLSLYAVVLAGIVGAFFVAESRWRLLKSRQMQVDEAYQIEAKKIEQIQILEDQRAKMMDKAEVTAALVERIPRWALMGELTLRMPTSMKLETVTLKGKRIEAVMPPPNAPAVRSLSGTNVKPGQDTVAPKVTPPKYEYSLLVGGVAESNTEVADYLLSLRMSPVLQDVDLSYIKEQKEKELTLRRFEVSAVLRSNVDTQALSDSLQELVAAKDKAREEQAKTALKESTATAKSTKDGANSKPTASAASGPTAE